MRIDMHMHTSDWSDGKATAVEMIQTAINRGLHGLVITDHDRMLQKDDQKRLADLFPDFRIFRGAEASLVGSDHILLVGGTGQPLPAEKRKTHHVVRDYARDTGALSVMNHPFWWKQEFSFSFDEFCPECMDVMSMNIDTARSEQFLRVAVERNMQLVACSDAHDPRHVGLFHIDLDNHVDTDDQLVREIRAGRFRTATLDDLWAARVAEITREEGLARQVMAAGGTLEDFVARGGMDCFFKRVAIGGSYMPDRRLLGIRSSDFGIRPRA